MILQHITMLDFVFQNSFLFFQSKNVLSLIEIVFLLSYPKLISFNNHNKTIWIKYLSWKYLEKVHNMIFS